MKEEEKEGGGEVAKRKPSPRLRSKAFGSKKGKEKLAIHQL